MSSGIHTISYVAAALVIVFYLKQLHSRLPSTQLRQLEALLVDTEETFEHDLESGYLVHRETVAQAEQGLVQLWSDLDTLKALSPDSLFQECMDVVKGSSLLDQIRLVSRRANDTRELVMKTSHYERTRFRPLPERLEHLASHGNASQR